MGTLYYLDSSIAIWAIMRNDEDAVLRALFEDPNHAFVSSVLLKTEIIRTLRRDNLPIELADSVLEHVRLIAITPETFTNAESIEQHIKTLDAIHLGEALRFADEVTVLTHDHNMKRVAEANNLATFDPIDT